MCIFCSKFSPLRIFFNIWRGLLTAIAFESNDLIGLNSLFKEFSDISIPSIGYRNFRSELGFTVYALETFLDFLFSVVQSVVEGLKSPVTKAAYSYALQKYTKHHNLNNPDDLLSHRQTPQTIQNQIIEYLIQLKNPPHSLRYATRSQYLAAIMTFYELNEIVLNKKKIYRYLGEEELPIENRGYTTAEISKMLELCDERTRAIILLLASTGIRIRAVIDLKIEDLIKIADFGLYQVKVYSDSKQRYLTFTTPEAAKAIDVYLQYRERFGERLTPKSPLFREQFDREDVTSIHSVSPLRLRTVERLISRTVEKAGVRTVERTTELCSEKGKIRKNVKLTAGFRKFFDTQLIYCRVEPRTKELLMGHSIGLDDHYFTPGESYVLQEYLKAVDFLTINEENRLRIKVDELTKKKNEIETMELKHDEEIRIIREQMYQLIALVQKNPKLLQVKPERLANKIPNQVLT
jgi:integrase